VRKEALVEKGVMYKDSVRCSYSAYFRIMAIKHAKETNNCKVGSKCIVSEENI
jgi:hypothetical protein